MLDHATLALACQRIALVLAELALLGRGHEREHVRCVDVAQQETGFDEVIARVEIAVVLKRRAEAARRRVDAQQVAAEEGFERHVEELHEHVAHVVAHPLFEDIDQEAAVLFSADRALGDQVAGLCVKRSLLAGRLSPALVGDGDRLLGGALDDGDELHPLGTELVAEETVDGAAVFLIGRVDRCREY